MKKNNKVKSSERERHQVYTELLLTKSFPDQKNLSAEAKKKVKSASTTDISKFFKANSVRIKKDDEGYYYIADLNGINCIARYNLILKQRSKKIFPNPLIYKITPKVLRIEVRPRYLEYAQYALKRMLTRRYLYHIESSSNHITLYLMDKAESENVVKYKDSSQSSFPAIALKYYETNRPLIEGVPTNEFLSIDQIYQLLSECIEPID